MAPMSNQLVINAFGRTWYVDAMEFANGVLDAFPESDNYIANKSYKYLATMYKAAYAAEGNDGVTAFFEAVLDSKGYNTDKMPEDYGWLYEWAIEGSVSNDE